MTIAVDLGCKAKKQTNKQTSLLTRLSHGCKRWRTCSYNAFSNEWFGVDLGEDRAGCFALFVFLVSHVCCVALPRDAMGLSAVCDCGIS